MWEIKYWRRCPEWHEQCSPYIVNEKGEKVVEIPCFVFHPGEFDAKANEIAETIVKAVNMLKRVESLVQRFDDEIWLEERGYKLVQKTDVEHWQFDLIKRW